MKTILIYDIPNDRTRTKVADFCLDYGLDRIQFSAFQGDLSRTYQEELVARIGKLLGKQEGKVKLFCICAKDWEQRLEIEQEGNGGED